MFFLLHSLIIHIHICVCVCACVFTLVLCKWEMTDDNNQLMKEVVAAVTGHHRQRCWLNEPFVCIHAVTATDHLSSPGFSIVVVIIIIIKKRLWLDSIDVASFKYGALRLFNCARYQKPEIAVSIIILDFVGWIFSIFLTFFTSGKINSTTSWCIIVCQQTEGL